jgi:hypothetical protein
MESRVSCLALRCGAMGRRRFVRHPKIAAVAVFALLVRDGAEMT